MSDEETSDSLNPFGGKKKEADYNPFESDTTNTYPVDKKSSNATSQYNTAPVRQNPYQSENMQQSLLGSSKSAAPSNPYYISGAYDDMEEIDVKGENNNNKIESTGGDWENMTENQLDHMEAEIKRREQALLRREKEVLEREKDARLHNGHPYNWPCAAYPIAYHDINEDIPNVYQAMCRKMYGLCLLTLVVFPWNWICLMTFWTYDYLTGSGPFIWGTIFVLTGVPGAWKLWYRNFYSALKEGRIRNWFCFFFWFFCHTCFCITAALGIKETHLVGFIHMIDAFNKAESGLGMMALISAFMWTVAAYCSVRWIREAWQLYQKSGKSSSELIAEGHRIIPH